MFHNSMTAFLGSDYYCHYRKTPYLNKDRHKCKKENNNKICKCFFCNGKSMSLKIFNLIVNIVVDV
jgi:hypothetical protein